MDKNQKNSQKLGKGLGALLGGADLPIAPNSIVRNTDKNSSIPIHLIEANPYQPRTIFELESLEELAQSIKSYGLITPVTVRPVENGRYQLISGERRLRACKIADLKDIPAFIRTADDQMSIQMALVENIQREDLNALEIAVSFQRLMDECNLNQEEMSQKVGKNRSTVANYLRLLNLCKEAQIAVRDNLISMGHARAIVVIEDEDAQNKMVKKIINDNLSVRQTEELVKKMNEQKEEKTEKPVIPLSDKAKRFKTNLTNRLHAKVSLNTDMTGKGKITIAFDSKDHLDKIMEMLS